MRARERRATVALVIVVLAALSPGVAHAQEKRRTRDLRTPSELWNLYPLNPLEDSPAPTPTATTAPVQEGEGGADTGSHGDSSGAAQTPSEDGVPILPVTLTGLVVLAAAGAWALVSRAPRRRAAAGAPLAEPSYPPPLERPRGPAVARTVDLRDDAPPPPVDGTGQHVRVHLNDGRRIEGWKKDSRASDQRVLILDVDAVYDASGHEVVSTSLDRFLLPPQIERIEPLD